MNQQGTQTTNKQLTYSPIDNSIYVERTQASRAQINQALELAVTAQQHWRNSSVAQRKKICFTMLDAFVQNSEEIAQQICWMIGRPIQYVKGEITGMVARQLI